MLNRHVYTVAQNEQTKLLSGSFACFAFLVAIVGESEKRGVQLVGICNDINDTKSYTMDL